MRDLIADLNRRSTDWPALYERDHEPTGFQWLDANDADNSMYSFLRWGYAGGTAVACVANFTPVPRMGYRIGVLHMRHPKVGLTVDAGTEYFELRGVDPRGDGGGSAHGRRGRSFVADARERARHGRR